MRNVNKLKLRVLYCGLYITGWWILISWKLLAPLVPNTLNVSPHRKRNWPTPIAPDEKCQQTETTCTILRIVHYRWAILILRLPTEIGHKFDEIIYWEKTGRNSSKRNVCKIVIFVFKTAISPRRNKPCFIIMVKQRQHKEWYKLVTLYTARKPPQISKCSHQKNKEQGQRHLTRTHPGTWPFQMTTTIITPSQLTRMIMRYPLVDTHPQGPPPRRHLRHQKP